MRMRQESLAARMRDQGFKTWRKQTVSELEAGRRAIQADEILGLAIALETTVLALMAFDAGAVEVVLPSGMPVAADRIAAMDDMIRWEGDHLVAVHSVPRRACR